MKHNDVVEIRDTEAGVSRVSVLELLRRKHPDPIVPPRSALIESNNLPALETVEITGNIIQFVGSVIQGSAGPCGCDASHWQDVLLRYGAHSSHLREAVASLARRLCNCLVPWSEIQCLDSLLWIKDLVLDLLELGRFLDA